MSIMLNIRIYQVLFIEKWWLWTKKNCLINFKKMVEIYIQKIFEFEFFLILLLD